MVCSAASLYCSGWPSQTIRTSATVGTGQTLSGSERGLTSSCLTRPFAAAMSAPTRFAGTTGHPGKAAKTDTKTGIAFGMVAENANRGKITTKLIMKPKPSYRKGKLNKRVAFVKEVVREVVGFSPYEKRCMELMKVGRDKRAMKLLKHKLGACLIPLRAPPCPCAPRALGATRVLAAHTRRASSRRQRKAMDAIAATTRPPAFCRRRASPRRRASSLACGGGGGGGVPIRTATQTKQHRALCSLCVRIWNGRFDQIAGLTTLASAARPHDCRMHFLVWLDADRPPTPGLVRRDYEACEGQARDDR